MFEFVKTEKTTSKEYESSCIFREVVLLFGYIGLGRMIDNKPQIFIAWIYA
jgi:hypothetical protein